MVVKSIQLFSQYHVYVAPLCQLWFSEAGLTKHNTTWALSFLKRGQMRSAFSVVQNMYKPK